MEIVDSQAMNPSSELERLHRFVQREVPGMMVASVHCRIHPVNGAELEHLTVNSLPRSRSHIETVMLPNIDPSLKFAFTNNDSALEVLQKLVEYPSLTELSLSFSSVQSTPHPDDGRRLFSLLSAGRSISTLRITFTSAAMFNSLCISTAKFYAKQFFHTGLPILLKGSRTLHSLTLEGREVGNESPRWMRYGFSRTVADSWALNVSGSSEKKVHHHFFPLKVIVALFPALAELRYHIHSRVLCRRCQCALINVVKYNRSLEKVDLGGGDYFSPPAALVSALGRNSSLKEFGLYLCSSVEFRALMRIFTPERQANTTLSTLKVRLPAVVPLRDSFEVLLWGNPLLHSVTTLKRFELVYGLDVDHVMSWKYTLMGSTLKLSLPKMNSRDALLPVVLDCMLALGAALGMNDTRLQRVELSQESYWPAAGLTMGSASHAREERDVQSMIGARLEQMRENELRQNTRLQSLHLGWWRMVRAGGAGDRWETKYTGPCLDWPVQQKVYVVKVRMRRRFYSR